MKPQTGKRCRVAEVDADIACSLSKRARCCCGSACQPQFESRFEAALSSGNCSTLSLEALADGPYFTIALYLGEVALPYMDASSRLFQRLNGLPGGPWQIFGDRFYGLEVDDVSPESGAVFDSAALASHWSNGRFHRFRRQVLAFGPPFGSGEITKVETKHAMAFSECRVRADLLQQPESARGVYLEVEVLANADNVTLAVVDFEAGGSSSITFSPETGAVLRERKVCESPREIDGEFIHLMKAGQRGRGFHGTMGFYLRDGHLAFMRRWAEGYEEDCICKWLTTGFCTDLHWAKGPRLSMCLSFRSSGIYNVRLTRICRDPPIVPNMSEKAYSPENWHPLYDDDVEIDLDH